MEEESSGKTGCPKLFEDGSFLPHKIFLKPSKLGVMTCRTTEIVLRYHKSKKKHGHEEFYSEMLLLLPWRDENEEFYKNYPEMCIQKYNDNIEVILMNKNSIFPCGETLEDVRAKLEILGARNNRPQHIFDAIDNKGAIH